MQPFLNMLQYVSILQKLGLAPSFTDDFNTLYYKMDLNQGFLQGFWNGPGATAVKKVKKLFIDKELLSAGIDKELYRENLMTPSITTMRPTKRLHGKQQCLARPLSGLLAPCQRAHLAENALGIVLREIKDQKYWETLN